MKKFLKHSGTSSELNITPLLDLVIVLLMIFIIAVPQLTNDLELSLPSAQQPKNAPQKPPQITYIGVDATGALTIDQAPCQYTNLKPTLIAMHRINPEMSVVLRGSEEANYELVVSVLDVLQQADITRIGLATEDGSAVSTSP